MSVSVLFGFRGDGGRRDELFSVVRWWWESNFPDYQICVGENDDEPFHRGKARNNARSKATGDILIVADADTLPTADAVREAVKHLEDHDGATWVLPYAEGRYYNLSVTGSEWALSARYYGWPVTPREPVLPDEFEHKLTSWAGCLIVPKEAWDEVGGYDERFIGWGGEDNAFQLCLDMLWGHHVRIDSYICHLWHERGDADFSQPFWTENQKLLRRYQKARNGMQMMRVRFE